jgi:hypothetical protein
MLAYSDQTGEALAGELRPGNAGANTAAEQIQVAEQALAQIPTEHIESIEILLRGRSTGASRRECRRRTPTGIGPVRQRCSIPMGSGWCLSPAVWEP